MVSESQIAWLNVLAAAKYGLDVQYSHAPIELRRYTANCVTVVDVYQARNEYRWPGVTVGAQVPKSIVKMSFASPST